jgi:probable rRNA maturation factor
MLLYERMPEKRSRKSSAEPFLAYEKEALRALLKLLPYASTSTVLRKKAGFPSLESAPAFGLDVTFVTRAKMKNLNRKFRGKDAPTDILSFPALEIFARQGHLGDLVICAPILEDQAKRIGHTPAQELHVLLVHGLLHLLGYDHEKSRIESNEMEKWENQILGDVGLIQRVMKPGRVIKLKEPPKRLLAKILPAKRKTAAKSKSKTKTKTKVKTKAKAKAKSKPLASQKRAKPRS